MDLNFGNPLNTTQNSLQISSSTPTDSQAHNTSHRKRKDQNKITKKNQKNKKQKQNDADQADKTDNVPVFDETNTQNKTAVELRCLAELHATSGTDPTLVNAILQLHEEFETLKAIKALQLGTTVSVIDQVFGKYIAVRRPSGWNYFLRSDMANVIFKEASGIGSGTAMKILSEEWRKMDQDEKQVYNNLAKAGGTIRSGIEVEPDLDTLEEDLEAINVGSQSRYSILQPRTNILVKPRCLQKYKENAERLCEEILNHCMPIAKANHFEVAIVAVSNHIGKHNFQITNFTAGAHKPVSMIYAADGVNNFPARLQALMLGKTPGDLASAVADSSKRFQSRVVASLSTFLHETTGLKNWPWSRCDKVLSEAGFEVRLLPGARSQLQTLKTPSAKLNQAKLLALDSDLKENLIQLVRTAPQGNQHAHLYQTLSHSVSATTTHAPRPNSNFDPSLM
ncbi:hypothetical protein DFH28DRAFT_1061113 [Melampsora americana]|nr:hypothetical protein DFH28DRAFT_1061113 [Melampsora americana]